MKLRSKGHEIHTNQGNGCVTMSHSPLHLYEKNYTNDAPDALENALVT